MGSQRIVSKLGDLQSYGADPRRIPYAGSESDNISVDYKGKYAQQQQSIKNNYKDFDVPYNGVDNDNYVDGDGFCCSDNGATTRSLNPGQNDNYERAQFYYHPDHLGSSSFITNLDGDVAQHIEYVPFGEVFIEERNNVWNTPYLFNAKELDEETGLYYYGARYYDSRVSLWLSTDQMELKYPNVSSYCYTINNPILYIDLEGYEPTLSAYRIASKKLGVSIATIRAVYITETGGNAYYNDGKLKILFERHYFHKATKGKFDKDYPKLSNPNPGGYGKYSMQHPKFEEAKKLDEEAAYYSTSFTGFQIMGANYSKAGDFSSSKEFGDAMLNGTENEHLYAFVNFVYSNSKMIEALQEQDWAGFAKLYNGPGYKKNNYDVKMQNNFNDIKDNPYSGLINDDLYKSSFIEKLLNKSLNPEYLKQLEKIF